MILAAGFPNPIGWAIDKVTNLIGGVATAGFQAIIGGLVAWVVDATVWVVGGVFNFFVDATDPNVQADWFDRGPYATTMTIGIALLALFLLAGIVQGILAADTGGMLRRIALDLPVSVLGMVALVSITQATIRLTDVLSMAILDRFQADIASFTTVVASLARLAGGISTAFVVFVLALVTVIAGLIVVAELVVRAALIYIVVALAPLVLATRLWPATRGAARKLLELLFALILSKLVIAVALAVAAAAAVGAGSGGEVTVLPEPEVFAEDPGGSVAQAVGILLAAAAAFGVAAFSPLLVARLLPLTEAAVVAHGIRGGPARAGQQALGMTNSAAVAGHRLSVLAAGPASNPAAAASAIKTRTLSAPGATAMSVSVGSATAVAKRPMASARSDPGDASNAPRAKSPPRPPARSKRGGTSG